MLDLKLTLDFLDELSRNNHKAWFDAHRAEYKTARGVFERFIDDLIDDLRSFSPLEGLTAKDCIARINRDVRFSRDKSPYKTNFGAMITPGGWGASWLGYYVSVSPNGQSMVGGGLYDPSPEQLARFRARIDADAAPFKKIVQAKAFVQAFGEIEGERLITAPKGYAREHPDIALLQLKQVTAIHRYSDEQVLARDFARRVLADCRAMKPLLDYLR